MKAFNTILAGVMTIASLSSFGQTADEVIGKYVKAMGGSEKLASLKTVKMEGTMTVQGADISITLTKKHLAGLRMDMEIMGSANYQMATPEKGWVFMPVMGQTEPQAMEPDQLNTVQPQIDVQGVLFNYKEKGYAVEFLGSEKVDGKDAYKLKVSKGGKDIFYFIDVTTNFIVKAVSKTMAQGQEIEAESSFADFKQNADGYWFPYSVTNMQGTIAFNKIETNIQVDDKIFNN